MKPKTLIFLNPFTLENLTREQQTEFLYENMYENMIASGAFGKFGKMYDYKELPKRKDELKAWSDLRQLRFLDSDIDITK